MDTQTEFVKLFAPYVKAVDRSIAEAKKKRDIARNAAAEMTAKRDRMLKFEDKTEINALIHAERVKARMYEIASRNYLERLDMSAFSLRQKEGLPVFMIIDANAGTPEFRMQVQRNGHFWITPFLPDRAKAQFTDVAAKMRKQIRMFESAIELSAQLSTVLPDVARSALSLAMEEQHEGSKLFDNIFIVAEAPKWNVEKVAKTDPIIVGYSKYVDEFFVITTYNPTDLETFLKEQFAAGF